VNDGNWVEVTDKKMEKKTTMLENVAEHFFKS